MHIILPAARAAALKNFNCVPGYVRRGKATGICVFAMRFLDIGIYFMRVSGMK